MAAPEPPLLPGFPMTDLEAELMDPGAQGVQAAWDVWRSLLDIGFHVLPGLRYSFG